MTAQGDDDRGGPDRSADGSLCPTAEAPGPESSSGQERRPKQRTASRTQPRPPTAVPPRTASLPLPRPDLPRAPLKPSPPIKGRRARLALRRLDPWSVFVTSLLLSLFLAVVTIVAAVVLYAVLDKLGIPRSINKTTSDVQGGGDVLTRGRFIGGAALLAAINVLLLTALATLGSLLYNLCATFTGGLELTLNERD